tara:strand:- start:689 stop:1258 length:570 start_codon:yes stop_codon:yes gene_type:complete
LTFIYILDNAIKRFKLLEIDNINPIKDFFAHEKIQKQVYSFFRKYNYQIINKKEYLDRSYEFAVTQGESLPQVKNVGFLGVMNIKELKSIQEKRTFKKLKKQINRILDKTCAPLTVDRNGYIINGHHRYDALKILKKKKITVRVLNLNASDMLHLEYTGTELNKMLKHHQFNSLNLLTFKPESLLKKIS